MPVFAYALRLRSRSITRGALCEAARFSLVVEGCQTAYKLVLWARREDVAGVGALANGARRCVVLCFGVRRRAGGVPDAATRRW